MYMNSLCSNKCARTADLLRCLRTAAAVIGLCAFSCGVEIAHAQRTTVDEKFRQATKAMREQRLDEAAKGFASVIAASPTFAEAYYNLGLVREEQGNNEEAIARFQKALALKPRLRGANLFLGVAEYHLNQLDEAVAAFRKETADYPSDANAWMWLGVAELAKEQPEDAAKALDKAANLAPDNVDILYHRGRAHLLVSKESYARMFKADPNSWRVHQVLAQADAEADRHDEAIAEYLAAIRLAPNQPGLHEELGTECRRAGKIEEAEAALQRELEIDPNNTLARYKLGTLEVERGDGTKGKALLEAARQQDPGLKEADYYLGRAEMELGNDAAAVQALKRAVAAASDPEVVEQAWYQLGMVYRRTHRMQEAQEALANFQKLKDEEAKRHLQRVEKKRSEQASESAPPSSAPRKP
jgi:tetratricopeptide (TPR) repeat protein